MPQTSNRISSIAARYINIRTANLTDMGPVAAEMTAADIRAMAASCLAQDEHRGILGLVRKVLGK